MRRIGAFLLALGFTTSWSLNSLHDLLLHHEHPVCEAAYDGKGTHIHDDRYEVHGCTLCALLMSAPELPSDMAMPDLAFRLPENSGAGFYHTTVRLDASCDLTLRRGPPAA